MLCSTAAWLCGSVMYNSSQVVVKYVIVDNESSLAQPMDEQKAHNCEDEIHEHFIIKSCANNRELGYAAFATQDIPKYTLILTEDPILFDDQIENAIKYHEDGAHCWITNAINLK